MGFKAKGNPTTPVLAVNLLMAAFRDNKDWPDSFLRGYIDDALTDRLWVDLEECKPFVNNVLTAFGTKLPSNTIQTVGGPSTSTLVAPKDDRGSRSRSGSPLPKEGDSSESASGTASEDYPTESRFAGREKQIEQYVSEVSL